jgi:hypothetical protein
MYMNINLYENKSGHYEHIYFIIKLYRNKPGHYKHIYFNMILILPRHCLIYDPDSSPSLSYIRS